MVPSDPLGQNTKSQVVSEVFEALFPTENLLFMSGGGTITPPGWIGLNTFRWLWLTLKYLSLSLPNQSSIGLAVFYRQSRITSSIPGDWLSHISWPLIGQDWITNDLSGLGTNCSRIYLNPQTGSWHLMPGPVKTRPYKYYSSWY